MKDLGGTPLTVLLWVAFLGALLLIALRWVDSRVGLVAVLQSMVPLGGILVAVVFVGASLTRRWPVTIASGALLALCVALAAPSVLGHRVAPGRDDLVVMSANLQYGAADAETLVAAVRAHRVDVLVLVEVTPAAVERLGAAGLEVVLPESAGRLSPDANRSIVRSRIPMTVVQPRPDQVSPWDPQEVVVSLHLAGDDVLLRAVHPLPPALSGAADWRAGLADLQAWRERQPPGQPLVLAGDFNASWGHPGYRAIAQTMTDAHRAAGQGWVRTWPQGRRLIRPFVQLDHVLTRGLDVVDAGVVRVPKTDHAAVWARLALGSS